jgi:hypothetical protein
MGQAASSTFTILGSEALTGPDFRLGPDVIFVLVDDGTGRLIDLNGGVYAIDQTAVQLVHTTLIHGRAVAIDVLAHKFDVPIERLSSDLDTLLRCLYRERLTGHRSGLKVFRPALRGVTETVVTAILSHGQGTRMQTHLLLALARLSFFVLGFSTTIRAWSRAVLRAKSARLSADAVCELVRSVGASHWLVAECKERALCSWALLGASGATADLVLGISLYPLRGHCWCALDGEIVADDPERCALFEPVKVFT